jgi:hypothetical protein
MTDTDDGTAVVVLVVEDETLIRLLANDMLSEAGYRVLEARDGQEALTILEVHADVRALFTDVTMPNVDGLSLAKIVSERWPQIGILLTSGLGLVGPAKSRRETLVPRRIGRSARTAWWTKSESNRRPLVRTPGSNSISLRGAAVPPKGSHGQLREAGSGARASIAD